MTTWTSVNESRDKAKGDKQGVRSLESFDAQAIRAVWLVRVWRFAKDQAKGTLPRALFRRERIVISMSWCQELAHN
jgi:hypothetical protein